MRDWAAPRSGRHGSVQLGFEQPDFIFLELLFEGWIAFAGRHLAGEPLARSVDPLIRVEWHLKHLATARSEFGGPQQLLDRGDALGRFDQPVFQHRPHSFLPARREYSWAPERATMGS